jgi:antitoxin MazE
VTHVIVGRWGDSLAIRFPEEIADALRLREGERVEIEAGAEQITIRHGKPHYTLDELFAGESAQEWRVEYAGAFDWGPDVGREFIED